MGNPASSDDDLRSLIRHPEYRRHGAAGDRLRQQVSAAYAARYPGPGPRELAQRQGEEMVHVRAHQRRGEDGRQHPVRAHDRAAPPAGAGRPAASASRPAAPGAAPQQPARAPTAPPGAMPPRAWIGQPNQEWRERIAHGESRGRAAIDHGYGARNGSALGRYQMNDKGLRGAGWRSDEERWTAAARAFGVRSDADFLASPAAQEAAFNAYVADNERQLRDLGVFQRADDPARNTVRDFDGAPLRLTRSGLAAAAHREGPSRVRRFLEHRDAGLPRPTPIQGRGDLAAFNEIAKRLREFADVPYEPIRR